MTVDIQSVLDVSILLLLVLTAMAAINSRNLLTGTILLGIFSLLMAAEYLIMGAADVAITEAAVGAGISTILFLLTLFLVGEKEQKSKTYPVLPFIVVFAVGAALIYSTFYMPEFGSRYAPAQIHVSPYYLANGPVETGIPNVVTSILSSYRGFDTFGEVVVVLTAAIAIIMLLGRVDKKEDDK